MEIKPFKAFRYDASVVGNVGLCIAPPYDVIDSQGQELLYNKSPYNIVRIIRGKTFPTDNENENQYSRAVEHLNQWQQNGALKQDDQETIYGYVQDFKIGDQALQRLSFISLSKLEEFGTIVKAHEQIFAKPMADRLRLKKATSARFGLVFMLYDDPEHIAESVVKESMTQPCLLDSIDEQGVRHRLFAITSQQDQARIIDMMADKICIIADGHHRYTTGLTLSKEMNNPNAKYQMVACANIHQPGVVVLATHRLVRNVPDFNGHAFIEKLQSLFTLHPFPFNNAENKQQAKHKMLSMLKSLFDQKQSAFGIYFKDSGCFYIAILNDKKAMDTAASDKSKAWRDLDVAVLHKLILEKNIGINEEQVATGRYLTFVKDVPTAVDDSITQIETEQKQIAFFTNPITFQQLFEVAEHNERMPQKSTYFYPKMFTGLTIQKL